MSGSKFGVLFVCTGNICRSPTAEAVFRKLATDAGMAVTADSAGTHGYHIGEPPDSRAYCRVLSRPQAEADDVLRAALQRARSAGPLLRRAAGVRARARYARGCGAGLARVPAKGLKLASGFKPSEPEVRSRFPPEPGARRDPREAAGARAWLERI